MKRIRFVQRKLCKRMECGESQVGAGRCRERGQRCVCERPWAQESFKDMKQIETKFVSCQGRCASARNGGKSGRSRVLLREWAALWFQGPTGL
jgi:hypothetical protein